ncbi:YfhO family protein [Salinarimonas soli]|uniref:YfhO family protein n=1 Tax=Salinarimonas soli TaxID=1638099 RepID=A0A5B2V9B2_9HYPH|nr:YfhO family protein [Salinarimonas soli]KAA2235165.1 YfhO family protein [Salinarimonas soli]
MLQMSPQAPAASLTSAWTTRETRGAFLAAFAIWAVAAMIWPLTGAVVPWDSKNHFYPMMRYLGSALAGGELPLWNPYHFGGHPSVADPQSLLFTPTMLFFAWLNPQASMEAFDVAVFAHFLPGAAGLMLLFRRRNWHWAGALVAVSVFILGGSASARLQHTGQIISYGYIPLALWLLEEALDRRSYGFAAAFGVVAALMTVGRDQVAFLGALTMMAYVAYETIRSGRPLAYLLSRAPHIGVMALVGAALLAVPTLLTLQLLSTSNRPSFGFGLAAMGSLPPESLATVLFGNVFGSLRWTYDYWGPDWHTVTGGTHTDRATNYLFAGTVPALLILWHGIAGRRLLTQEFRFFLGFTLAMLVYAVGRSTPAFELLFDHVPGIALYRRPSDATFLINIALALAAGYLVHRYARDGAPRLAARSEPTAGAILSGALAIALVLAAVLAALSYAIPAGRVATALGEIALGGLIAGAAAFLLLRGGSSLAGRTAMAALLVAATGGELVLRNAGSSLNSEPAGRYAVFTSLPSDQLQGLSMLKRELAARHERGERPRVEILGLPGAWQNAAMVLGIEDTIGYNPLRIADYERAVGPGENAVDPNLRHFPGTFRSYRGRLASLLCLDYVVLDRPADKLPKHFPRLTGAEMIYGSGSMWIYRLNTNAARAYLATRLVPVESDEVLSQEELPEFDRTKEALIDHASVAGLRGDYGLRDDGVEPAPSNGSVRIERYGRNAVRLHVQTDRTAVLVLHDLDYPGWEAWVDGERRPILRTNLLFRGVEVSAGQHVVEFRFRPLSVRNLVAAAAGLVERGAEPSDAAAR